MNKIKEILIIALSILVVFLFFKSPKKVKNTIIKNEIETKQIKEPIVDVKIPKPKIVYVESLRIEKGKDSIIYSEKPTETTTLAKQYDFNLKSKKATADLKITTTGELIDVSGAISYPETIITKTIEKEVHNNGLFLYVQSNPAFQTFGGGADLVIKNRIILGIGVLKINGLENAYITGKVGLNIF